jgi:DnaK suppressor protein
MENKNNDLDLEKIKKNLEAERNELLKQLEKFNQPIEFGNDVADIDEEVAELEEFSNKISESEVIRNRLNEIDYLINKIKKNEYGICDNCSKEISKEDLKKNPELIFCSFCQKKQKK